MKGLEGIEPYTFFGLIGPVGIPANIVARLNETFNKVSAMPDEISRMRNTVFSEPSAGTPTCFRAFLERELSKWREVGKTVNRSE